MSASESSQRPIRIYFCSKCGEMLGVNDHIRIRHEHFDEGWPTATCRGGHYEIVEYAPTGRDLPSVDRERQESFNNGFQSGYERGRDDERIGREPPWSVRDASAA